MHKALIFSVLLAAVPLVQTTLTAQQPNPPLAQLKAAAEDGDAQAQDALAEVFRKSGDFEDAVTWYRKSAPHGILNSQYQLAHILLLWAGSPTVKNPVSALASDEGIPWLLKAASRRHSQAELELGQLCQAGRYLKKDLPEAYKWFSLAADGSLVDPHATIAASYRDGIILKMTQEQIADGNRRVYRFLADPAKDTQLPEPSYFQHLKLQGIAGTPGYPLAIINGRTLGLSDSTTITVDTRSVTIQCQAITANSATILIEGFPTPKQLTLP